MNTLHDYIHDIGYNPAIEMDLLFGLYLNVYSRFYRGPLPFRFSDASLKAEPCASVGTKIFHTIPAGSMEDVSDSSSSGSDLDEEVAIQMLLKRKLISASEASQGLKKLRSLSTVEQTSPIMAPAPMDGNKSNSSGAREDDEGDEAVESGSGTHR